MKRIEEFDAVTIRDSVGSGQTGGRLPFECIALL